MTKGSSIQEDQTDAAKRRASGEFVRGVSQFRHSIGDPDFPPEPNRYHLFVALNCPWCHRATLARAILGLENIITMDIAFPNRTEESDPVGPNLWQFAPNRTASLTGEILPECTLETATGDGLRLVKEIYEREGSDEQSVPVLYDKVTGRIVNNESAEIIRILDQHAAALGSALPESARPKLVPHCDRVKEEADVLNERIYTTINNGAYKAGFSSDQSVYAAAFEAYFETLSMLEDLLSDGRPFLTGDTLTEVDLRLFPTLYRHDPIYYIRMKLNGAKILDYPNLWRWLCRFYQQEGIADAGSLLHCRQGYFGRSWNNVVPLGPLKPMPYPAAYLHPELTEMRNAKD